MVENNIMITMVMDLVMFAHSTGGKERAHQEWKKIIRGKRFFLVMRSYFFPWA
jgi:hypothetical protein